MTGILKRILRAVDHDSPAGEWLKGVCLVTLAVSSAALDNAGAGVTAILTVAHVGGLAAAGSPVLRVTRMPRSASLADRLVLSYLFGWVTVPLFALFACLTGSHAAGLGVGVALLAGGGWWLCRGQQGPPVALAPIPWPAYLAACLYVLWNVVMPFRFFGIDSLVREMYGDGFQRFGATYALASSVPPANPFVAGRPLFYYWLAFYPYALEFRFIHPELFAIWKCGQLWTAAFLVIGLWGLLQAVFRNRAVAWTAMLLGFFFASYEILASPSLQAAIRAPPAGIGRIAAAVSAALGRDPDHILGIVNAFSDQLFLEDFLYIPHNAVALAIVLVTLWWLTERRYAAAALAVSTLAGFNTFYLLAVAPALGLATLLADGLQAALFVCMWMAGGAVLCLSLCGIVPVAPPLALAVAVTLGLVARHLFARTPQGENEMSPVSTRLAALVFVAALLWLVASHPLRGFAVLLLNYGPAFPLGLAFMVYAAVRARRAGSAPGASVVVFLATACACCWILSGLLMRQYEPNAPAFLKDLGESVGQRVNLFNLYHKVSKLVRLTWCVFAGLAVAVAWPGFRRLRTVSVVVAALVLLPAALTGLVRARTYCIACPTPEAEAARFLIARGCSTATTVLLENYRASAINQLAPVTAYYMSSWAGGEAGLTHKDGTWADQYLPAGDRPETQIREAESASLFAVPFDRNRLQDAVRRHGIRYILTQNLYDLRPAAWLVVFRPGGYLYEVDESAPAVRQAERL
jgi:hypothetical protein